MWTIVKRSSCFCSLCLDSVFADPPPPLPRHIILLEESRVNNSSRVSPSERSADSEQVAGSGDGWHLWPRGQQVILTWQEQQSESTTPRAQDSEENRTGSESKTEGQDVSSRDLVQPSENKKKMETFGNKPVSGDSAQTWSLTLNEGETDALRLCNDVPLMRAQPSTFRWLCNLFSWVKKKHWK